jgi:hypothetical protein
MAIRAQPFKRIFTCKALAEPLYLTPQPPIALTHFDTIDRGTTKRNPGHTRTQRSINFY